MYALGQSVHNCELIFRKEGGKKMNHTIVPDDGERKLNFSRVYKCSFIERAVMSMQCDTQPTEFILQVSRNSGLIKKDEIDTHEVI